LPEALARHFNNTEILAGVRVETMRTLREYNVTPRSVRLRKSTDSTQKEIPASSFANAYQPRFSDNSSVAFMNFLD
jgi:hypothetical protein